jgi:hypothetical protein
MTVSARWQAFCLAKQASIGYTASEKAAANCATVLHMLIRPIAAPATLRKW